ncbi:uncharacterized protein TNCV_2518011 [Trichonephila clavipes]|nr:uncharacterized protein TNCV_2518011 [Trichonephila clavipes]
MAPHTITPAVGVVCRCISKAGLRHSPRSLHTRTRLSSLLRLNLDSSLKTTWFHSSAVHFPRSPLQTEASMGGRQGQQTVAKWSWSRSGRPRCRVAHLKPSASKDPSPVGVAWKLSRERDEAPIAVETLGLGPVGPYFKTSLPLWSKLRAYGRYIPQDESRSFTKHCVSE